MAFKLPTMSRETSSSTSTGDMVMAGAQSGYFAFSAGLSNGDTTFLTFKMGADTEEGLYTYNSGANSFTRTQIYRSTNANAAVNWIAGTKDVICGLPGPSDLDSGGKDKLAGALGLIRAVKFQPFTGSGTYTPSTGMLYCLIEAWGGGGGGGGAAGAVNQFYIGGGGGAGGYSRLVATAATIGASKTVTIGAAGNGGATGISNGSAGGDTSVGVLCIGKGGSGGLFSSAAQVGIGGLGGVAGTGDLASPGAPGQGGFYNGTNSNIIHTSGAGGNTIHGGGGIGQNAASTAVTGATATGYGSGGGGGSVGNSATSAGGGGGLSGYVFIYDFCTQ